MKLDLWRALGIGAGSILAYLVASLFVYSLDVELVVSDYLMVALTAVILALFTYWYFEDSKVAPSAMNGFVLALVMYGYNFLIGFLGSLVALVQEMPAPLYPEMAASVLVLGTVVSIAAPTVTGWYMGRK